MLHHGGKAKLMAKQALFTVEPSVSTQTLNFQSVSLIFSHWDDRPVPPGLVGDISMITAPSCLPEAAAPDAGHPLEIFSYLSQEICAVPNLQQWALGLCCSQCGRRGCCCRMHTDHTCTHTLSRLPMLRTVLLFPSLVSVGTGSHTERAVTAAPVHSHGDHLDMRQRVQKYFSVYLLKLATGCHHVV